MPWNAGDTEKTCISIVFTKSTKPGNSRFQRSLLSSWSIVRFELHRRAKLSSSDMLHMRSRFSRVRNSSGRSNTLTVLGLVCPKLAVAWASLLRPGGRDPPPPTRTYTKTCTFERTIKMEVFSCPQHFVAYQGDACVNIYVAKGRKTLWNALKCCHLSSGSHLSGPKQS